MKIEFQNHNRFNEILPPQPASRFIPEWYKTMPNFVYGKKVPDGTGHTSGTVKTCIPFLDTLTSGYIIPLPCDVFVALDDEGAQVFEYRMNEQVTLHRHAQLSAYPDVAKLGKEHAVPKFTNAWGIKTPPGYSCLFTTPLHRDLPFKLFEGIVDTDSYHLPIHFPFLMKDPKWEGLIPVGTPMAQIFPFRRDSWELEIVKFNETEEKKIRSILNKKIFDSYKTHWWKKKSYR